MYSNTSRTPDKKNSYLNKFKKKQIATTDKENRYILINYIEHIILVI